MKPSKSIERGDLEVTASRVFPFDGRGWYFAGEKKNKEKREEKNRRRNWTRQQSRSAESSVGGAKPKRPEELNLVDGRNFIFPTLSSVCLLVPTTSLPAMMSQTLRASVSSLLPLGDYINPTGRIADGSGGTALPLLPRLSATGFCRSPQLHELRCPSG